MTFPSNPSPSLALCIPAYNAAACLPRLLRSAQAQTVPFQEIWVYDDCSQDGTAAVAEAHGAKVIRGQVNRGCSWGKNNLAQASQCDWIHFHDADDDLLPDFVAAAQDWMGLESGPDVVIFGYEYREESNGQRIATYQFDDAALGQDAIAYCITHQINPFCGLYRRVPMLACGGYDTDPRVLYNEDVAFHCRLAIAGLRFAADVRTPIVNYRQAQSMSNANRRKCIQAQYQVMAKVAAQLTGKLQYGPAIGQRLWQLAGVAAASQDWTTLDDCIALAQQLGERRPLQEKPWFTSLCGRFPHAAFRLREQVIRWGKPQLRQQSWAKA